MTRYSPSRSYFTASAIAVALGGFSAWFASEWAPAMVAATLFAVSAVAMLALALRPTLTIEEEFLGIGKRRIPWASIRRVDRTGWVSPLVVYVTLESGERLLLLHPGDLDSGNSLLRHLRRFSRGALIDGIPHDQFWGRESGAAETRPLPSPKYRLLREEDEQEVERLYRRLKTVGHLDSSGSPEDN